MTYQNELSKALIRALQTHKQLIDAWDMCEDPEAAAKIKKLADEQKQLVHKLQEAYNTCVPWT